VRPQRYRPNNKVREEIYQPDVIGIVKKIPKSFSGTFSQYPNYGCCRHYHFSSDSYQSI